MSMQKKAFLLTILALFSIGLAPAYAQDGADDSRSEMKKDRDTFKADMRKDRDDFKAEMDAKRDQFKKEVEAKRKSFKAEAEANRNAFKAKIQSINDSRKKTIAQNLDTKLASINEARTEHMSEALIRLQEILNRLIDRTNEAKANGADTASVETAINSAKTAITNAQSAVATQKAKTYTASITDEASLGASFKTTIQLLRSDLQTVHNSVKAAKTAVKQVAVELAKVEVIPTETVTPTP